MSSKEEGGAFIGRNGAIWLYRDALDSPAAILRREADRLLELADHPVLDESCSVACLVLQDRLRHRAMEVAAAEEAMERKRKEAL